MLLNINVRVMRQKTKLSLIVAFWHMSEQVSTNIFIHKNCTSYSLEMLDWMRLVAKPWTKIKGHWYMLITLFFLYIFQVLKNVPGPIVSDLESVAQMMVHRTTLVLENSVRLSWLDCYINFLIYDCLIQSIAHYGIVNMSRVWRNFLI